MKFVGPVDVRSLNTPSGAVTLYRPFLSDRDLETEIIKNWNYLGSIFCIQTYYKWLQQYIKKWS